MSNQQVTVTARLKVKPGLEEGFKQEFQPVIALTLTEEGCINYDLHQSVEDPSLFLLHENWVSQEILAQHLEQPYIKALSEKSGQFLVEPPEVRLWQQIANNSSLVIIMTSRVLLYGATGYAGKLIAASAKNNGLELILAGRNQSLLAAVANELSLDFRVFGLDDPQAIARSLEDIIAVINCSGPFSKTSKPLVDACLQTKTHYLDIAGEVPEFQALLARDTEAKSAGIMLLPGVGFGVVPTDCVAAYLKQKLAIATRLILIYETVGGVSQGTANTVLPTLHHIGVVREAGKLISSRPASKRRKIDFGYGPVTAVTNPWRADIITAFQTTGIPNIEVYTVFPNPVRFLMESSQYLGWLFNSSLFQSALASLIKTLPTGPTAAERAKGQVRVIGIAEDETGQQVSAKLLGPEAYDFTALAAIAVIKRVIKGEVKIGFQTPASVYGADFVLEIPGVIGFN